MSKKLYVGGLSYSSTEDDLRDLFSRAGDVEAAKVILDRESGRSKGFGFVEMTTEQGSQNAIREFDGVEFGGRTIVVNEARPQAPSTSGGFRANNSDRQRW